MKKKTHTQRRDFWSGLFQIGWFLIIIYHFPFPFIFVLTLLQSLHYCFLCLLSTLFLCVVGILCIWLFLMSVCLFFTSHIVLDFSVEWKISSWIDNSSIGMNLAVLVYSVQTFITKEINAHIKIFKKFKHA